MCSLDIFIRGSLATHVYRFMCQKMGLPLCSPCTTKSFIVQQCVETCSIQINDIGVCTNTRLSLSCLVISRAFVQNIHSHLQSLDASSSKCFQDPLSLSADISHISTMFSINFWHPGRIGTIDATTRWSAYHQRCLIIETPKDLRPKIHQPKPQTVYVYQRTPPHEGSQREPRPLESPKKAATPTKAKAARSKVALRTPTVNCLGKNSWKYRQYRKSGI